MASSVENVINKALVGIGANRISSIDDTTPTAVAAKLFYDSARRSVIQDCNWGFARRTAVLETCKDVKVSDTIPRGVPENGRPDSRNFYEWEEVSQPYLMFDEPPDGNPEIGRVTEIGDKIWIERGRYSYVNISGWEEAVVIAHDPITSRGVRTDIWVGFRNVANSNGGILVGFSNGSVGAGYDNGWGFISFEPGDQGNIWPSTQTVQTPYETEDGKVEIKYNRLTRTLTAGNLSAQLPSDYNIATDSLFIARENQVGDVIYGVYKTWAT